MKALVFIAAGEVAVLDVDEPSARADETVFEVVVAGICGSELHGVREPGFRLPPLIMGHEFSVRADDGHRYAVNPHISCGTCRLCEMDHDHLCPDRQILGVHRPGGFAERVAVRSQQLHRLPEDLPTAAGPMVEPLATGLHAWRLVDDLAPNRVGVIGAGTIGLMTAHLALTGGGAAVDVVDIAPERLAVTKRLGARTKTSLDDEYDVVVDAVGSRATHQISVDQLRAGGAAVWLGLLSDDAAFDATALVRQEKRVLGSFAYTDREFGDAVALTPTLPPDWATTFPLEDGARIFSDLMNGRSDVVKAVLGPSSRIAE